MAEKQLNIIIGMFFLALKLTKSVEEFVRLTKSLSTLKHTCERHPWFNEIYVADFNFTDINNKPIKSDIPNTLKLFSTIQHTLQYVEKFKANPTRDTGFILLCLIHIICGLAVSVRKELLVKSN